MTDVEAMMALRQVVQSFEASQWCPAAELQAHQYRKLVALAIELRAVNPSWAARLSDAGLTPADLGTPAGLRSLPVLTRRDLQAAGTSLFSHDVPEAHRPVHETCSSGSTGEPVVVQRTSPNQVLWSALTLRDYGWRRLDFGGRFAAVRATVDTVKEAPTWGAPLDWFFETGPSLLLPVTTPIDELAERLEAFRPTLLLIYPTVLDALVDRWRGGEPLQSVEAIQSVSETFTPRIRAATREVLGAELWDTYSSQEIGIIALECPSGSELLHIMSESVLVEVLADDGGPCEVGAEGQVVVTDLFNVATPLVRYEIGDRVAVGPPCPCGRGLPTLARLLGRERNLALRPDGTRFWPLVGIYQMREVAPVEQFQLVQSELDTIDVRLVVERPLATDEESALRDLIRRTLGYPFELRFAYADGRLDRNAGGKFEEFVNELL